MLGGDPALTNPWEKLHFLPFMTYRMNERSFFKQTTLGGLGLHGLLAVLALILTACGGGNGNGGPPEGMAQPVLVETVRIEVVEDQLRLIGTLQAVDRADLSSVREGRIAALRFTEGQVVNQGDVLIELDARVARAAVAEARAAYQLASAELKRNQDLIQDRTISPQEFDRVEGAYAVAKAALQRYKEHLADMTILAPFSGVIGNRNYSEGQYVAQGQSIARLVAVDPMEVVFNVPERFLGRLALGQRVDVRIDAFPGEIFQGEVVFIDPELDRASRTARIKALVPNEEGKLRQGMLGRLAVITETRDEAPVVAESAIVIRGTRHLIYVVGEENTIEMREVKTGRRLNGRVEIREGVAPGEVVVIEGVQKVWPGSLVEPREMGKNDDHSGDEA